jgi:hypothetical protein
MRQAGVLAAAGIYALQNNVARLAHDHENARALAQALREVDGLKVDYGASQTNMVFVTVEPSLAEPLRQFLKQRGILIGGGNPIRLVTHLDVSRDDIQTVAGAVKQFCAQGRVARPLHWQQVEPANISPAAGVRGLTHSPPSRLQRLVKHRAMYETGDGLPDAARYPESAIINRSEERAWGRIACGPASCSRSHDALHTQADCSAARPGVSRFADRSARRDERGRRKAWSRSAAP